MSEKIDREKLRNNLREIKKRYPRMKTALLPSLHVIQDSFGYLSPEGLKLIEEEVGISRDLAISIASFYQFFRLKPLGRIHIQVCTNLTCLMRGALDLLRLTKERYKIDEGEISGDGWISYEEVECIGLCDGAPALLVNGERFEKADIQSLAKHIDDLRKKLDKK